MSRRFRAARFLRHAAALGGGCWLGCGSAIAAEIGTIDRAELPPRLPAAATLDAAAWATLPPHPRLFADTARWTALTRQIADDPESQQIFAVIRATAERLLDQPPVAYVDKGAFWHGPMRRAQGRILALAMTFRLTGDARFLARAKREMQTLADLPNWYPQHFLDTAEGALAMAVGLDWLHEALAESERASFAEALVEKALRVSLVNEAQRSWIGGMNNWTAVCHGGLVVGALAVAEREPELARQIVERALRHLPHYAELYAPAGAYSEGPDYWAYGTTFYTLTADALRTVFGTTAGLENAPGFLQTADYTRQMTAPSGQLFNFADNGSNLGCEPVMFWFARELRRPDLTRRELANLATLATEIAKGEARDDSSRLLPLALLWRDPALASAPAPVRPLVWSSEGGSQPQAVLRAAWDDPRATFLGIKAGRADDSHAHLDAGSFILEADGVRWAVDLGRESYAHARAHGLSNTELFQTTQESRRWSIFRCGAESHNLLRFGAVLPRVDAMATIAWGNSGESAPSFVVDLSATVRATVAAAQRTFQLCPDRSVEIRDEWTAGEQPAEVAWQWLTFARVAPEADGFSLEQSGETLRIRSTASATTSFAIEDVSAPRAEFDSPNPGLRRLIIRLQTPARGAGWLHVSATPGTSKPSAKTPP